jgi:hypothetical protein
MVIIDFRNLNSQHTVIPNHRLCCVKLLPKYIQVARLPGDNTGSGENATPEVYWKLPRAKGPPPLPRNPVLLQSTLRSTAEFWAVLVLCALSIASEGFVPLWT